MPKRRISHKYDAETNIYSVDVDEGAAVLTLNVGDLAKEMVSNLIHAGLRQTIGDAAASKTKAGTTDEIREALLKRWNTLVEGKWTTRVASEGGPRKTLLAQAIARVKGVDVEDVIVKLADLDDEKKKALRKNSQVAAAMAEIKAEEAKAKAKEAKKAADSDGDFNF